MVRGIDLRVKKSFLSPRGVIENLEIKTGDIIVDFGSGSGFWSIPLAEKVGKSGKVYVTDPKIENLTIIKRNADRFGLKNIVHIQAPYDLVKLPTKVKADLILISNVLSLIKNDEKLIKSLSQNAHRDTRLVIIDWDKETKIGPKFEDRSEVEEIILWAKEAGFIFRKLLDAGSHHFGLYFEFGGK